MAAPTHVQYNPGQNITGVANEVLVAARFVKANGTWADGGNIPVEYSDGGAAAAGVVLGITGHDVAAIGDICHIIRPGSVCEVESSATIAAGVLIKATTDGKAAAATAIADVALGITLRGGANGDRLMVAFFAAPTVVKLS